MSRRVTSKLQLERVLGLTSLHQGALAVDPMTGNVVYAAGCIAVLFDPHKGRQVRFYRADNPVFAISFSPNGQYIAVGERSNMASVVVWEAKTGKSVAKFSNQHKRVCACVKFSPDGRYLCSIGGRFDRNIIVWDLESKKEVMGSPVTAQVRAITWKPDSSGFLVAGEKYLALWEFNPSTRQLSQTPVAKSRFQEATFVDVCCWAGSSSGSTNEAEDGSSGLAIRGKAASKQSGWRFLALTSDGWLCSLGQGRQVEKTVKCPEKAVFGLDVTDSLVSVAGANASVYLYSPSDLSYQCCLPTPKLLPGPDDKPASRLAPATIAARLTLDNQKVLAIYGDRTLIIWDVSNTKKIERSRTFRNHCGPVWDIRGVPCQNPLFRCVNAAWKGDQRKPKFEGDPKRWLSSEEAAKLNQEFFSQGTFATCSSDSTVRFWNLDPSKGAPDSAEFPGADPTDREGVACLYLQEEEPGNSNEGNSGASVSVSSRDSWVLKRVVLDQPYDPEAGLSTGLSTYIGARAIALSAFGDEVAVGDREGNLRVFEARTMRQRYCEAAHEKEIVTLEYSPLTCRALVTGSADGYLHVFDASANYRLAQTLDFHKGPITAAKFRGDDKRLVTCSTDNTIAFSDVTADPSGELSVTLRKSAELPEGAIHDMTPDVTGQNIITGGADKRLSIWSARNGRLLSRYKPPRSASNVTKVVLDPSGLLAATCYADASVRLYDFFTGVCLAKAIAHADGVTSAFFTPDCRRVISTGMDGCIMVWRLSHDLTQQVQERIEEVKASRQAQQVPPSALPQTAPESSAASQPANSDRPAAAATPAPVSAKPPPSSQPGQGFRLRRSMLPDWARSSMTMRQSQQEGSEEGSKEQKPPLGRPATAAGAGPKAAPQSAPGGSSSRPESAPMQQKSAWQERLVKEVLQRTARGLRIAGLTRRIPVDVQEGEEEKNEEKAESSAKDEEKRAGEDEEPERSALRVSLTSTFRAISVTNKLGEGGEDEVSDGAGNDNGNDNEEEAGDENNEDEPGQVVYASVKKYQEGRAERLRERQKDAARAVEDMKSYLKAMNLLQTMNAEEPGDKPEEGDGPSKLNDTGMPTVEQLQKDLEMLNEIEKAATETNEGENLDEESTEFLTALIQTVRQSAQAQASLAKDRAQSLRNESPEKIRGSEENLTKGGSKEEEESEHEGDSEELDAETEAVEKDDMHESLPASSLSVPVTPPKASSQPAKDVVPAAPPLPPSIPSTKRESPVVVRVGRKEKKKAAVSMTASLSKLQLENAVEAPPVPPEGGEAPPSPISGVKSPEARRVASRITEEIEEPPAMTDTLSASIADVSASLGSLGGRWQTVSHALEAQISDLRNNLSKQLSSTEDSKMRDMLLARSLFSLGQSLCSAVAEAGFDDTLKWESPSASTGGGGGGGGSSEKQRSKTERRKAKPERRDKDYSSSRKSLNLSVSSIGNSTLRFKKAKSRGESVDNSQEGNSSDTEGEQDDDDEIITFDVEDLLDKYSSMLLSTLEKKQRGED